MTESQSFCKSAGICLQNLKSPLNEEQITTCKSFLHKNLDSVNIWRQSLDGASENDSLAGSCNVAWTFRMDNSNDCQYALCNQRVNEWASCKKTVNLMSFGSNFLDVMQCYTLWPRYLVTFLQIFSKPQNLRLTFKMLLLNPIWDSDDVKFTWSEWSLRWRDLSNSKVGLCFSRWRRGRTLALHLHNERLGSNESMIGIVGHYIHLC